LTSNARARLYTPAFWLACAIHVTGALSLNMFLLFPLFVRHVGGGDLGIGLVIALGTAASVVARPLVGHLLDHVGRRPVLLAAGALNVVSFLPFLAIRTFGPALLGAAVLHWIVWGALFAAYFTYASDLSPAARRAEGVAVFGIFGLLSIGAGPALGERLIAAAGFHAFFATAAGLALSSVLLTLAVPRAPAAPPAGVTAALAGAVRRRGLGRVLVVTAILGAAIDVALFFVAPFTRDVGIPRAAPFFAAHAVTAIAVRLVGRRVLDRLGAHRVAIPMFAVCAAGLGALTFLPVPGLLAFAGACCGAAHGTLFPVLNALALARAPAALEGRAVSLVTAAFDLGAALATPAGGALAQAVGYPAMFAAAALLALLAAAALATDPWPRDLRDWRRARPPDGGSSGCTTAAPCGS
jgi:MFS family permease